MTRESACPGENKERRGFFDLWPKAATLTCELRNCRDQLHALLPETSLAVPNAKLSRTDLRRRQSHNLNGTLPTPRSGVGLNDLLG